MKLEGHDIQAVGGKAKALLQLVEYQVPSFVVLAYDELKIVDGQIDNSTVSAIKNKIGDGPFAVRSSAHNEDNIHASFAGQYHTELNVYIGSLASAVQKVWQSAAEKRVEAYAQKQNIVQGFNLSIIVQKLVDVSTAGVAFGANPLTGNANEIVINAVPGYGEGLVNGDLVSDQYIVGETISSTIVKKEYKYIQEKDGGLSKINIDDNKSTLTESQINAVADLVKKLNHKFHHPQDIEFAFDPQGQLYLLQSRPITTPYGYKKTIYDNSNIIESYPGLTSPLTYSFIEKMYTSVYRQLSALLGVPDEKIERHKEVYQNMLAHIKGRVYYNLNNWYQALALVPGYALNASFMEKMMGVKEKFDIDVTEKNSKWKEWWLVIKAIIHIVRSHNGLPKDRIAFKKMFDGIADKHLRILQEKQSLSQLIQNYKEYETTLVKEWNAPQVNDFFAMIYFGMLTKLCANHELGQTIHNDLLIGSNDIVSRDPADRCIAISKSIKENNEYYHLFTNESPQIIWQKIKDSDDAISSQIKTYMQIWGARSVGELKLETVTYQQDPSLFIHIIKQYVLQGVSSHKNVDTHQIRREAEKQIEKLSWLDRRIFRFVLRKARDLVSNRENLRYERTKGFAITRNYFLQIEDHFVQMGKMQKGEIFYLTQEEIYRWAANLREDVPYLSLIQKRKSSYAQWSHISIPERVISYVDPNISYVESRKEKSEGLNGIGCCAGIVRAPVIVLHRPDEIGSLSGAILVTSSTDPGWITLFPTASGILVERGSLLSHSAIVSREMGIPCVVGISGLLQALQTGMIVEMDGSQGTVKIIS
jgi:rifampicin phosphotransferase